LQILLSTANIGPIDQRIKLLKTLAMAVDMLIEAMMLNGTTSPLLCHFTMKELLCLFYESYKGDDNEVFEAGIICAKFLGKNLKTAKLALKLLFDNTKCDRRT